MKRLIKHRNSIPLDKRLAIDSVPVPWSGCHIWLRTIMKNGYGVTSWHGKRLLAHRAAWIAANGSIPDGLCVLHRCDIRCCINPDHLFLGTIQDNDRDRDEKGRMRAAFGERHGKAKLTAEQVIAVRSDLRSQYAIAADYGVNPCTIWQAKNGKTWRHLTSPSTEPSAPADQSQDRQLPSP